MRATNRQGKWWDVMKSRHDVTNRKRKMVDERASFEKFKGGVTVLITRSCNILKSSMEFCKSRILRKKSFDISPAGLMVRGGASGGPFIE